eukprot:388623_1
MGTCNTSLNKKTRNIGYKRKLMKDWTTKEVCAWLYKAYDGALAPIAKKFKKYKINGIKLQRLTENELDDMNISPHYQRIFIRLRKNRLEYQPKPLRHFYPCTLLYDVYEKKKLNSKYLEQSELIYDTIMQLQSMISIADIVQVISEYAATIYRSCIDCGEKYGYIECYDDIFLIPHVPQVLANCDPLLYDEIRYYFMCATSYSIKHNNVNDYDEHVDILCVHCGQESFSDRALAKRNPKQLRIVEIQNRRDIKCGQHLDWDDLMRKYMRKYDLMWKYTFNIQNQCPLFVNDPYHCSEFQLADSACQ